MVFPFLRQKKARPSDEGQAGWGNERLLCGRLFALDAVLRFVVLLIAERIGFDEAPVLANGIGYYLGHRFGKCVVIWHGRYSWACYSVATVFS